MATGGNPEGAVCCDRDWGRAGSTEATDGEAATGGAAAAGAADAGGAAGAGAAGKLCRSTLARAGDGRELAEGTAAAGRLAAALGAIFLLDLSVKRSEELPCQLDTHMTH